MMNIKIYPLEIIFVFSCGTLYDGFAQGTEFCDVIFWPRIFSQPLFNLCRALIKNKKYFYLYLILQCHNRIESLAHVAKKIFLFFI